MIYQGHISRSQLRKPCWQIATVGQKPAQLNATCRTQKAGRSLSPALMRSKTTDPPSARGFLHEIDDRTPIFSTYLKVLRRIRESPCFVKPANSMFASALFPMLKKRPQFFRYLRFFGVSSDFPCTVNPARPIAHASGKKPAYISALPASQAPSTSSPTTR